jgi:hypothetical protein
MLIAGLLVACQPEPMSEEVEQPAEVEPVPSKIMATFDGKQCQVDGPTSALAGLVFFSFDNQSDSTARIGVAKLVEGVAADEVLAAMGPSSVEIPDGAAIYSSPKSVLAGKTLSEYGIEMEPGKYTLACVYVSSNEAFPGAGLTISE